MSKRITHDEEVRWFLYNEFFGRCGYCGCDLNHYFHVDHIHPLKKGGGNEIENLIASCVSCNLAKSTLTVEQFREHMLEKHDQLLRDEPKYSQLHRYGIIKKVKDELTFHFEKEGRSLWLMK